jgi:hypothetical protein
MSSTIDSIYKLAERIDLTFEDNGDVDPFLPFFERIAAEGGVVVVKWDGKRGADDGGKYTVIISNGKLGEDYARADGSSLKDTIASGVVQYGSRAWRLK